MQKIKPKKIFRKPSPFSIVCGLVLTFYSLILFFFLYMAFVTSLKNNIEVNANALGLPKIFKFENYARAFKVFSKEVGKGANKYTVYFDTMLLNSIIYAVSSSLIRAFIPCIMAYVVAKYRCFLNGFITGTVIIAMILPIVGALPAEIMIVDGLHLRDSWIGNAILNASYLGSYYLIYMGTFKSLSDEYLEAAWIDGAGHFQVFVTISLPLVRGTFWAIFILRFVTYWNDYSGPLIYLPSYPTASTGLLSKRTGTGGDAAGTSNILMAGCMMLSLPIFVLFMFFKKLFMGNLTVGGLKG